MSGVLAGLICVFVKPRDRKKFWKLIKSSLSLGEQKPRRRTKSAQKSIKKEKSHTSNFVLPQGFQLW